MCTKIKYIIIGLFFIHSVCAQTVVNSGDTLDYRGSSNTISVSLTNFGTILIDGGTLYSRDGITINNGTIDLGSNSILYLKNGESNGDNAFIGSGQLNFYRSTSANLPNIFIINGENTNFTGRTTINRNVWVTLNSTKGLGEEYGDIVFAGDNSYLILNIEGNQTFNKNLISTALNANVNKTGSGDLYFNASLGGVRVGSLLSVEEGSVYLDPDKSVYRFATIINEGAKVYFGLTRNSTLASAMSGSGDIIQSGDFTLSIDKDHRDFNGTYHVKEGGLVFADSSPVNPAPIFFDADIIAYENSFVGGFASIGANVTLKRGGTLFAGDASRAPGYEFGAQNIYFEDGSRYEVHSTNNATGVITAGNKIDIGDNVTVFVKASPDNSSEWNPFTYHTVARASSIDGEFGSVATDLVFLDPFLKYTNNAVMLILKRNDVAFNALDGLTQNQASTAEAAESIGFYDSNSVILTRAFNSNADDAKRLFNSLSGEFYASSLGVQKQNANEIKHLLLNRLSGYGNDTGYQDWVSVWGRDYHGSKGDFHSIKSNTCGVAAGFDSLGDDNTVLGLLLSYEQSKSEVSALKSESDTDAFYLSLYGSKRFDSFSLKGGIAGGISKSEADRYVSEFDDTLSAKYDGYNVQLFVEADKEFEINDKFKILPFAGASYLRVGRDGFEESGNVSALRVDSVSEDVVYLSLGINSLYALRDDIDFTASFGLQQALGDIKGENQQSFVSGSDSFTIYGTPVAKSLVKLGLGLDFKLSQSFYLAGLYEGEYAKEAKEHSAYLKLNYRF
jgi:uncharacterized protein with beta-barrel porin domain